MHGNVIGPSDPKSCVEESEIGAKTGVEVDDAEAEAAAEAEEEDTTDDDKTAGETAAEEIRKATERRCLRRERRRANLDIGDKESRKRHSSDDNIPKRLDMGSGGQETDKDDTLPEDNEGGREAGNEEEETWFEVGEREARFEVVAEAEG